MQVALDFDSVIKKPRIEEDFLLLSSLHPLLKGMEGRGKWMGAMG